MDAATSVGAVAAAGARIVGLAVQELVPAGALEDDQEERPESWYAGCNYYNVTLVAAERPFSQVFSRSIANLHVPDPKRDSNDYFM